MELHANTIGNGLVHEVGGSPPRPPPMLPLPPCIPSNPGSVLPFHAPANTGWRPQQGSVYNPRPDRPPVVAMPLADALRRSAVCTEQDGGVTTAGARPLRVREGWKGGRGGWWGGRAVQRWQWRSSSEQRGISETGRVCRF